MSIKSANTDKWEKAVCFHQDAGCGGGGLRSYITHQKVAKAMERDQCYMLHVSHLEQEKIPTASAAWAENFQ